MRKKLFFGWKGILATVILNAACVLVAVIGFLKYVQDADLQQIVDNGVVAEAEIVKLQYNPRKGSHDYSHKTHRLIYRYVADDGTVYEGDCYEGDFRTEEESYNRIGEKVEIYVGTDRTGAPISRYVGYGDVEIGYGLVYGSVSLGVMVLIDAGIFVFWLCVRSKYR